jgi:transcriptional regulator with XRE-family HTH domain
VERGWDAKGLLAPLWQERFTGAGRREQLAELVEISPQTLSAYNSGKRPLGITNARKLAAALGVSLAELGAPEGESDPRGATLRSRLDELAAKLADALVEQKKQRRDLQEIRRLVRKLEARHEPAADGPKRPRRAAG